MATSVVARRLRASNTIGRWVMNNPRLLASPQHLHAITISRIRALSTGKHLTFQHQEHRLQQQQQSEHAPPPQQPVQNQNPSYPAFSLDALGLKPRTKKLLIVLLCFWAMMETYVYGSAIHRWWTRRQERLAKEAENAVAQ